MIWAKIVNKEIMQTHDEDPAGLWHPDAIAKNDILGYWEEVPEYVNVGWKFKNDEWISGGQWLEEQVAETPILPPGPSSCRIDASISNDPMLDTCEVLFDSNVAGIYDSWSITIDGVNYSTKVTSTNSDTNELTCTTTVWLSVGDLVTFMNPVFGGVDKHTSYVVHSVVSPTKFRITNLQTPIEEFQLTTGTGNMMMSKGPNFKHTFQKTDSPQHIAVEITATNSDNSATYSMENDCALIIPEKWVPLFARP